MNVAELQSLDNDDLLKLAQEMGVTENGSVTKRHELMSKVLNTLADQNGTLKAGGILSIVADGYGFLRQSSGLQGSGDVYVSQSQIRRFGLRTGDEVTSRFITGLRP